MIKTAVLVAGQMRSLEKTADALKKFWPDAFWLVHAAKDDDADKAFLLKPNVVVIEEQPYIEERREYAWQIGRGCHGIQSVLRQLWTLRRAWAIFEKTGHQAECIVRVRADLLFRTGPELPSLDAVYIAKFCNFYGLNDRFAFGPYKYMQKYFTRLDVLDEYIDNKGVFHPETFLAHALKDVPVKRTNAVFDTLRKDGSLDKPVSKKEWNDVLA